MGFFDKQPLVESIGSNRSAINGLSKLMKLFILIFLMLSMYLGYTWWNLVSSNNELHMKNEMMRGELKKWKDEVNRKVQQFNMDKKECQDSLNMEKAHSELASNNLKKESERFTKLSSEFQTYKDEGGEKMKIMESDLNLCQAKLDEVARQPKVSNDVAKSSNNAPILPTKTNSNNTMRRNFKKQIPPFLGGLPIETVSKDVAGTGAVKTDSIGIKGNGSDKVAGASKPIINNGRNSDDANKSSDNAGKVVDKTELNKAEAKNTTKDSDPKKSGSGEMKGKDSTTSVPKGFNLNEAGDRKIGQDEYKDDEEDENDGYDLPIKKMAGTTIGGKIGGGGKDDEKLKATTFVPNLKGKVLIGQSGIINPPGKKNEEAYDGDEKGGYD